MIVFLECRATPCRIGKHHIAVSLFKHLQVVLCQFPGLGQLATMSMQGTATTLLGRNNHIKAEGLDQLNGGLVGLTKKHRHDTTGQQPHAAACGLGVRWGQGRQPDAGKLIRQQFHSLAQESGQKRRDIHSLDRHCWQCGPTKTGGKGENFFNKPAAQQPLIPGAPGMTLDVIAGRFQQLAVSHPTGAGGLAGATSKTPIHMGDRRMRTIE